MLYEPMRDRVRKLRVRSPLKETSALRMRIAQTFNTLDFRPAGMSPSAILLIEKLSENLPRDAVAGGLGSGGSQQWQSGIQHQLDLAYRQAERPVVAGVRGSANAVLFRDRAELLACLCRDVLAGSLGDKWWWKKNHGQLFNTLPRSAALRTVLLEAPRQLPSVFEQLASWQMAIPLVGQLDDNDADALTRGLLVEFSCSQLMAKLSAVEITDDGDSPGAARSDRYGVNPADYRGWFKDNSDRRFLRSVNSEFSPEKSSTASRSVGAIGYPPWMTLFSNQIWERRLSRSRARLLGLARTAFANPALLRNSIFEDQIAAWWSSTAFADDDAGADNDIGAAYETPASDADYDMVFDDNVPGDPTLTDEAAEEIRLAHGTEGVDTARAKSREPNSDDNRRSQKRRVESSASDGDNALTRDTMAEGANTKAAENTVAEDSADRTEDNDTFVSSEDPRDNPAPNPLDDSQNWLSDNYIDTEWGGIFYLINLLQQIELPDAMETDWHFESRLGHWQFLELIARGLVGGKCARESDDRIWTLLGKLSGRKPASSIGANYPREAQPDYRIPADWWDYLQADSDIPISLAWAVKNQRLRIWSGRCIIVDCAVDEPGAPCGSELPTSVQRILHPYIGDAQFPDIKPSVFERAPLEAPPQALRRLVSAPLRRWLSLCMPFIRFYLYSQLNTDSPTGDDSTASLLALPARIYFTASHVDMVADVNLTSLDIRRSGLDQDPGWQPLYGRVVLFHFSHV